MSEVCSTTVSLREHFEALLREKERAVEIAKEAVKDGLLVRITEMSARMEESRKRIETLENWRNRVLGMSAAVSAAIGFLFTAINALLK